MSADAEGTPQVPTTLPELVSQRAIESPDEALFAFLPAGIVASETLTFAELDARARAAAVELLDHARPGDRVVIAYPPGIDYSLSFFACLHAGLVAVPAVSPLQSSAGERLEGILRDSGAVLALSTPQAIEQLDVAVSGQTQWRSLVVDPLRIDAWRAPDVRPEDPAFLQYTSGSTSEPKGVIVSHRNMLANAALATLVYGIGRDDVIVSWLPPYHDMGLIGAMLYPLYAGCRCLQFPPSVFLRRPYRWLKLMSDVGATMTVAPNFAYALACDRVDDAQRDALRLDALRVCVNGAERVRPETMRRFAAMHARCGLRSTAPTAAYGLAESTLLVCADRWAERETPVRVLSLDRIALEAGSAQVRDDGDTIEIACVGARRNALHRCDIRDPTNLSPIAEGTIGEIWVAGPSVAEGYWRRPEATAATFVVDGDTRWMRTGDLGFVRDEALYIVGRLREMMIHRGRNLFPQDIERTVESLDPAFRADGCAAFSIDDDGFGLVVVQELATRRRTDIAALTEGLAARWLTALADAHEIVDVVALLLVDAGALPRTTSGKIQRGRCRSLLRDGGFAPVWRWDRPHETDDAAGEAPRTPTEYRLAEAWRELGGHAVVHTHSHLLSLGADSMFLTHLQARIASWWGVEVTLRDLFEASDLAMMAALVDARRTDADVNDGASIAAFPQADRGGPLPLSWSQQRLWFLDRLDAAASAAYHI
ncbi:MAG: AMP-binding protein, partial [Lysobacter sp.]|nr:AMP-binding protein [Lysobacter sp.]